MATQGHDRGQPRGAGQVRSSRRVEREHTGAGELVAVATGCRARRSAGSGRDTTNDTGYLVSCWRAKLRSCRGFPTLAQARAAAALHVHEAAKAFTDDSQELIDEGFLAAADWALHAQPEPDRPAGHDLADGTKIRVRLVSGDTARCLTNGADE